MHYNQLLLVVVGAVVRNAIRLLVYINGIVIDRLVS